MVWGLSHYHSGIRHNNLQPTFCAENYQNAIKYEIKLTGVEERDQNNISKQGLDSNNFGIVKSFAILEFYITKIKSSY